MKKKLLLLVVVALSYVSTSNASHVLGMRITYEYTGTGNDYVLKMMYYRDCAGVSAPTSVQIMLSSSCVPSLMATLPLLGVNQIPFNPCAGVLSTTCQGGTAYGFEEYIYTGIVTIPPCADWIANSTLCCRSFSITNLIDPDFYSMYVETRFDNLNFPGNSSPGFNSIPMNYYCTGVPSLKDYSAIDIDGDSLHYELVPVLDSPGTPVTMAPGYTYDQPLASFTPASLDPLNGMLLFTPSAIQVSALAFLVSEYRNGVLIGTVQVEDEIVVATGIANPDTVTGRIFMDQNSNGVFDAGDTPLPNVTVKLSPGNLVTTTTGNGKYEFFTIDGTWDITVPYPPAYTTITPATINVNTTGITYSGNNDFILEFIFNMDDLEININQFHNPIPGQQYPMQIHYYNSGTTVQSNVDITVILDPLLQFVSSIPSPTAISGDTLTWTFPSMSPFTTGIINVLTSVDTTATIGALISCSATITPVTNDQTPNNNSDYFTDNVATSCDPNYKEVSPAGDVDLAFIAAQDWLTYRVYFQNLGTAPAQTVRITDMLDTDLEFATLELVTSSFPCTMTLSSPNLLEFNFFGINLPAASVNEPASHGFVEYRIRPKANLTPGTYITNNAGIYFDFNAPVYTNLVHNKVVTSVGISENNSSADQISVYPNPASDNFTLEIFSSDSRKVEIEIFDLMGALVKKLDQKLYSGINRVTVPVMEFSSGEYFISVAGSDGKHVSKLSVVRD